MESTGQKWANIAITRLCLRHTLTIGLYKETEIADGVVSLIPIIFPFSVLIQCMVSS